MAFNGTPFSANWVEIFHSMPSWRRCFIVFRRGEEEWTPNATYELRDASHIRPGFRVFRIQATEFEFYLTNGSTRDREDNAGDNHVIEGPGRYVVGHRIMHRVGEADVGACMKALRSLDRFIEIVYRAQAGWQNCFIIYSKDGEDWTDAPGERMRMIRSTDPGLFFIRFEADRVQFALHNGESAWDSNFEANYSADMAGKYFVGDGACKYRGPSEVDRHAAALA